MTCPGCWTSTAKSSRPRKAELHRLKDRGLGTPVRLVGSRVRSETGTWTFTRGSGDLSGAHSTPVIALRGTRDLKLEMIALRIHGALEL